MPTNEPAKCPRCQAAAEKSRLATLIDAANFFDMLVVRDKLFTGGQVAERLREIAEE